MTLKTAALFAVVGMALLTILLTENLIVNVSGVLGGYIPATGFMISLIQWLTCLSLLIFFAVFYKAQ